MVQVAGHLSVAGLRSGYRESKDSTLARHYQVIWLLAQGRAVAETARLTGFGSRWVEELLVRYLPTSFTSVQVKLHRCPGGLAA